jgi:hypothetical protein
MRGSAWEGMPVEMPAYVHHLVLRTGCLATSTGGPICFSNTAINHGDSVERLLQEDIVSR